MGKSAVTILFISAMLLFTLFAFSFEYFKIHHEENETAIEGAARSAMTVALNKGTARVEEELTINKRIATEALIREYAEALVPNSANHWLNIYDFSINSNPAMIAVDAYLTLETPFMDFVNSHTEKDGSGEGVGRSRVIMIYEDKEE